MKKRILRPDRLRKIQGGFSFIPHRFYTDGFLDELSKEELLLYLFYVIVGDQYGLSFYPYDKICFKLNFYGEEYLNARDGLLDRSLIAFSDGLVQVLSLPVTKTGGSHG